MAAITELNLLPGVSLATDPQKPYRSVPLAAIAAHGTAEKFLGLLEGWLRQMVDQLGSSQAS